MAGLIMIYNIYIVKDLVRIFLIVNLGTSFAYLVTLALYIGGTAAIAFGVFWLKTQMESKYIKNDSSLENLTGIMGIIIGAMAIIMTVSNKNNITTIIKASNEVANDVTKVIKTTQEKSDESKAAELLTELQIFKDKDYWATGGKLRRNNKLDQLKTVLIKLKSKNVPEKTEDLIKAIEKFLRNDTSVDPSEDLNVLDTIMELLQSTDNKIDDRKTKDLIKKLQKSPFSFSVSKGFTAVISGIFKKLKEYDSEDETAANDFKSFMNTEYLTILESLHRTMAGLQAFRKSKVEVLGNSYIASPPAAGTPEAAAGAAVVPAATETTNNSRFAEKVLDIINGDDLRSEVTILDKNATSVDYQQTEYEYIKRNISILQKIQKGLPTRDTLIRKAVEKINKLPQLPDPSDSTSSIKPGRYSR